MTFLAPITKGLHRLADTHGLVPAFFLAAFLEATFIPLVIDLIMLSFLLTGKTKLWKLILAGAAASTIGTLLFWIAGFYYGTDLITTLTTSFNIDPQTVIDLQTKFTQNWMAATWVALLTAVPDAIVAILAGAQGIPLPAFTTFIFIGLLVRFSLLGGAVWIASHFLKQTGTQAQNIVSSLALIGSLALALIGAITLMV